MLRLSDRGFRAWRDRPISQRRIRHKMRAEAIANIHRSFRACHGVRPVHAELVNGLGMKVGRDQVALVMSRLGLRGISGIRKRYVNREQLITAEDLMQRKITAAARNQLSCTDITEHPARERNVYCWSVLDVHSPKIVGGQSTHSKPRNWF